MDSAKLLIIGGVVLGGFYIINKSKKDKDLANAQALIDANSQTNSLEIKEDSSEFYNKAEATKKALEVVTKWTSLLNTIPKEALQEENRQIIRFRVLDEQAKLNQNDYNIALANAKAKNESKFTFKGNTYWTANQEDVRNGSFSGSVWVRSSSNLYYSNEFNGDTRIDSYTQSILNYRNSSIDATLGDFVKRVKQVEFANIYDALKVSFTEIPKKDVDRLVTLLPKYLFIANDDFDYLRNKTPFTIEEQLFLKDIDVERVISKKRV